MSSSTMRCNALDTEAGRYVRFYNSPNFSDITIHYSDRIFLGHRLHLAVEARWFQKAFEGRFKGANEEDMTLKDDNPTALEGMLAYMYGVKISFPTIDISAANVVFCIELFRVADKYTCYKLIEEAPNMFSSFLNQLLSNLNEKASSPSVAPAKALGEIVHAVYEYEDNFWAGEDASPIRTKLIEQVFSNNLTNPLGMSGELSGAVTEVAKDVSEFGQDLYLGLMERNSAEEGKSRLVNCGKVACQYCAGSFCTVLPMAGWDVVGTVDVIKIGGMCGSSTVTSLTWWGRDNTVRCSGV